MDINVGIIDQQVRGLAQRLRAELADALDCQNLDDTAARSAAFLVLCAKVMLGLSDDEALDALTEGGNDFGVDAIALGDVSDGEFTVTLFQAKYHHENLEGVKGFPQSGVEKAVQAVRALFNPAAPVDLNPRLQAQVEEVRSLIVDGNIPRVRFLLCSNGAPWKVPEVQGIIDRERFGDRAVFEHVNHDTLVRILQSTAPVKDVIQFAGKAIVEDFNYARVFLGKVPVSELARLMDAHGDRLLERNIRRYLGLHGNRVNEAIAQTLRGIPISTSTTTASRSSVIGSTTTRCSPRVTRSASRACRSSTAGKPARQSSPRWQSSERTSLLRDSARPSCWFACIRCRATHRASCRPSRTPPIVRIPSI